MFCLTTLNKVRIDTNISTRFHTINIFHMVLNSDYSTHRDPFTYGDWLRLVHRKVIRSADFYCYVTAHSCPNFNGGLIKQPLKLRHV